MSVVAWDGSTVAADRQMTNGNRVGIARKIWRLDDGTVIAGTGGLAQTIVLLRWYIAGHDAAGWPERQQLADDWSRLIVFPPDGEPFMYEQECCQIPVQAAFEAWGSGGELAVGAMSFGATARQAVEIACRFDATCGNGCDAFDIRPRSSRVYLPEPET